MADRSLRIVLGVTGGVAAYKAAELARRLMDQGARVQVVMTEAATRFVTPATFQALTGEPVYTDAWDARIDNLMPHIELSRAADVILVAPATADFIAKLAHGLADDLLSTLCLAREIPLLLAPAMNRQMWGNAATQRNVATLVGDGVQLLGPAAGAQACGETGLGRMIEPHEIVEATLSFLAPKPITTIWGVGKAFAASLERDGLRTIGQLQTMERGELMRRYGVMGDRLHRLSRGRDDRRGQEQAR